MAQQETTPAGFWTWEPPSAPGVRIFVGLDMVDGLLQTIIDGFGSVPKRGAEVGGVLLGSRERVESGKKLQVTITGFVDVHCSHRFGPSYVLSDEDLAGMESTVANTPGVVGYYRSHTRDGLKLSAEDLQYCSRFFPGPDDVVLLVRPSAMGVSTAGFFTYEEGALRDRTALEFPFRRSELETGEAPQRRPLGEKAPGAVAAKRHGLEGLAGIQDAALARAASSVGPPAPYQAATAPPYPYPAPELAAGKARRNWVWLPLSFIFLLLGLFLGFQTAVVFSQGKPSSQDPYTLALAVERRGEDLLIRWDRSNFAIRTSSKAVLDIVDGKYNKRVDMDSSQLQNGSVIYRHSNSDVRFRLEVYPRDRVMISETIDWRPR